MLSDEPEVARQRFKRCRHDEVAEPMKHEG